MYASPFTWNKARIIELENQETINGCYCLLIVVNRNKILLIYYMSSHTPFLLDPLLYSCDCMRGCLRSIDGGRPHWKVSDHRQGVYVYVQCTLQTDCQLWSYETERWTELLAKLMPQQCTMGILQCIRRATTQIKTITLVAYTEWVVNFFTEDFQ